MSHGVVEVKPGIFIDLDCSGIFQFSGGWMVTDYGYPEIRKAMEDVRKLWETGTLSDEDIRKD